MTKLEATKGSDGEGREKGREKVRAVRWGEGGKGGRVGEDGGRERIERVGEGLMEGGRSEGGEGERVGGERGLRGSRRVDGVGCRGG